MVAERYWPEDVLAAANRVRRRVLGLTIDRNGGYLSQTLSCADILATLYIRTLNLGPSVGPHIAPDHPGVPGKGGIEAGHGAAYNGQRGAEYDRLLISPAHYAVAIYATLVETGRLAAESFDRFNTDGSSVEMIGGEHSPGFELTTGSFGQAISQAGGIALARRLRGETGRTVVFMSDGELEEGQTWEGVQCLAHYRLDDLIVVVDVNGMQCDGATADTMNIEPIAARIDAFGGVAVTVDAHDPVAIDRAVTETEHGGKPLFVLCYSNSAQGVPMLEERKPFLHYVRFGGEEEAAKYREFLDAWAREEV